MATFITKRTCLKRLAGGAAGCALSGLLRPPSAQAQEPAPQPKPNEHELAAINEVARQFMAKYNVPGLSVAIARHGQFVYREGFGLADKTAGEAVTPAHLFRIASVTKPITSVALFTLLEKGRLGLDDLVFGPRGLLQFEYGDTYPADVLQITIGHLLTHTSGGWTIDGQDPMFRHPGMQHHELIAWTLSHQPLKTVPGEHYAYSNFGYCILGRVLEKLTGQAYADFVREHVLATCGIQEMRLAGNTLADRAPHEVVYYGEGGENPYGMDVTRMDSHGGWLATASNLAQFAMHVDDFTTTPNILGENTIRTMVTPTTANPHYAKGWAVNKAPNWWHGGSLPGTTSVMVRTASGLCWAALANARAKGIDLGLDDMVWAMAHAVPAWKA